MGNNYLEVKADCCCGCGLPAEQLVTIRGITLPLPQTNPMTHYAQYRERLQRARDDSASRLQLVSNPLEHMTEEQLKRARESGL